MNYLFMNSSNCILRRFLCLVIVCTVHFALNHYLKQIWLNLLPDHFTAVSMTQGIITLVVLFTFTILDSMSFFPVRGALGLSLLV